MKRSTTILFYIVLVSVLVIAYYQISPIIDPRIRAAESWLMGDQYLSAIGLCREAPDVAPDKIWLLNDNLLACKALSYRYPTFANHIQAQLSEYNNYLDRELPIWNVIDGTIEAPFKAKDKTMVKVIGNSKIGTEVTTESIMYDSYDYTDLCCLDIMAKFEVDKIGALQVYERYLLPKWNGTGFIDKATKSREPFAIYKNALFLYVSTLLDEEPLFFHDVEATIWDAYNPAEGGFYTDYYADGSIGGDMNTETTSLVIIWYYTQK